MDDLILTVDQIAHEQDEAVQAFHRPGGPDNDLELGDYVNRYVCRAQVAKVVEWVKKNNCAPLQAQGTRTYAAHLVLPKESWQALKEAAGEGK